MHLRIAWSFLHDSSFSRWPGKLYTSKQWKLGWEAHININTNSPSTWLVSSVFPTPPDATCTSSFQVSISFSHTYSWKVSSAVFEQVHWNFVQYTCNMNFCVHLPSRQNAREVTNRAAAMTSQPWRAFFTITLAFFTMTITIHMLKALHHSPWNWAGWSRKTWELLQLVA